MKTLISVRSQPYEPHLFRQTGELTRSVNSSVAHILSHRSPPPGEAAWPLFQASCPSGSGPGL